MYVHVHGCNGILNLRNVQNSGVYWSCVWFVGEEERGYNICIQIGPKLARPRAKDDVNAGSALCSHV